MNFLQKLKELMAGGVGRNGVSQDNMRNYQDVIRGRIPQRQAEVYQNPDPNMRDINMRPPARPPLTGAMAPQMTAKRVPGNALTNRKDIIQQLMELMRNIRR